MGLHELARLYDAGIGFGDDQGVGWIKPLQGRSL